MEKMTYINFLKENIKSLSEEQKNLKTLLKSMKNEHIKNDVARFIWENKNTLNHMHLELEQEYNIPTSNSCHLIIDHKYHQSYDITKKRFLNNSTAKITNNYTLFVSKRGKSSVYIRQNNVTNFPNDRYTILENANISELYESYLFLEKELLLREENIKSFEIKKNEKIDVFHLAKNKIVEKYKSKFNILAKEYNTEVQRLKKQKETEVLNIKEYKDKQLAISVLEDETLKMKDNFEKYAENYIKNQMRLKKLENIIE